MFEEKPVMASLLRQQEVLAKFGELALRSDSLDEILMESCRLVSTALGTDLAKVMELQADGITLLVRAGIGWKAGVVGKVTVRAELTSSEGFALQTGQPVVSQDISTETRFEYADFIKDNGVRAIVSVIILGTADKIPFGILQVDSRTPRRFGDNDTRFLRGYANLIAGAVNRLRAADKIRLAAAHDPVTTLPNRVLFRSELDLVLSEAHRTGSAFSLLLIDLDGFKQINDVLGHQVGDAALCAFAERLVEALPPATMIARLGGDEFVVILSGDDRAGAAARAGSVLDALKSPFSLDGRSLDLRASIGISTFPFDGKVGPQLIGSADLALYAAKNEGGSRARSFHPSLRAARRAQLAMLRHARLALRKDWIVPFYQPQIALASGKIAGFEALLRWHHPRVGVQYPATIGYAFDDPSTAGALGSIMAEAALCDLKRWIVAGSPIRKLAINVSAAELRDVAYADILLARLARHGVEPALLEIEITETAFLDGGASSVIAALEKLRAAGVTVALDDFGTGYSSLSHLRDLPVDTIKIDRSFVSAVDKNSRDRSITEAVLLLGKALGMTTIAEGVETADQAAFLKAHGCTLAQGFWFSPAIHAEHAERHMMNGLSWPLPSSMGRDSGESLDRG
jgi:diguanylate cyclase (GGDEF)-like protein